MLISKFDSPDRPLEAAYDDHLGLV
ncbi:MAG: hypothetical protein RL177_1284, partial [Bacteroidota bacterium]